MLETRALLATYTVTNTSPSDFLEGSLPWAVRQANFTTKGLDYINFDIPGAGVVHSITLSPASLYLVDQVVIDGASQPGYDGQPLIYVQGPVGDGIQPTPTLFILQDNPSLTAPLEYTTSTGSTIQGLGMYSFSLSAVTIYPESTNNWIQNNSIGFWHDGTNGNDPALTSTRFASADGIVIRSNSNQIRNNTISGVRNGVVIGWKMQPGAPKFEFNSVYSNSIGTDPSGVTAAGYGNLANGILLVEGARQNYLGPNNVISGNASHGIHLSHSTNTGNFAFINLIGTNKAGTDRVGNGNWGILLSDDASGNLVGGFAPGISNGNVISGNGYGGVGLTGGSDNWVQGNIIGLNSTQTASLGFQQYGVGVIGSTATRNAIHQNIVAGHVKDGIFLSNAPSNYAFENWVGRRNFDINVFPNDGFGIVVYSDFATTYVDRNLFGLNRKGNSLILG